MQGSFIAMIALGGAAGAVSRYGAGVAIGRWLGHGFPYGTLGVNIAGSLLMGLWIGALAKWSPEGGSHSWHALIAIGFLGSFTTFSTFSLDTITLLERGQLIPALGYIAASISLSLLALMGGLWFLR